jgi:hypothetical protein
MTQGWKWGIGVATAMVMLGLLLHWHNVSEKRNILGSVNTEFNLIGPDHKIIIESYDDPKIDGITVFISKSQTGGIKGALGLAEDTSDASVAVRQTGPIRVKEKFDNGGTLLAKNVPSCSSGCMSAGSGTRRTRVLYMWCGLTGSSTAHRRIQFRR